MLNEVKHLSSREKTLRCRSQRPDDFRDSDIAN